MNGQDVKWGQNRKVAGGESSFFNRNNNQGANRGNQPQNRGNGNQEQRAPQWEELPTKDGNLVEGRNEVVMQGVIAYQNLSYTASGIPRCTAKIYIPFTTKEDKRIRIGYSVQAWGDVAEALASLEYGTPIYMEATANSFSWNDKETGAKNTKIDFKILGFDII